MIPDMDGKVRSGLRESREIYLKAVVLPWWELMERRAQPRGICDHDNQTNRHDSHIPKRK